LNKCSKLFICSSICHLLIEYLDGLWKNLVTELLSVVHHLHSETVSL